MDRRKNEGDQKMITFNYDKAMITKEDVVAYQSKVSEAHQQLHGKTGKGNEYLGWLDLPTHYDQKELGKIKEVAKEIQNHAEVLLVCGIGGSYLGARAAIEMIQGLYADRKLEIIYVGNSFSSTYFMQIQEYIKGKSVYLNVISKSGTTAETAIAFRILRQYMEETYGEEEATRRIIATTDKEKGTLKYFSDDKGYRQFCIPDDIGGRFSITTAVGLLPIAAAGIDVDALLKGTLDAFHDFNTDDLERNLAYQYAVARRVLEKKGKTVELLVNYEPQMTMFAEWWKQLFGESEGKEGKGLFPASVNFSTDLHSMGQFVQEGNKLLFETLLLVKKPLLDQVFPKDDKDQEQLNYLSGKTLDYINKKACEGTIMAHVEEGGVPNLTIEIEDISAYSFGYLVYFFFKSIAMTAYLLDVNPFNQPGVEVYKKNMFRLLGKEGS